MHNFHSALLLVAQDLPTHLEFPYPKILRTQSGHVAANICLRDVAAKGSTDVCYAIQNDGDSDPGDAYSP